MTNIAANASPSTARKFYLLLSLAGVVAESALLAGYFVRNGPNFNLLIGELFGNFGGAMAMADLLLSSVAFWCWIFSRGEKGRVRSPWLYVVLNLAVGLCFALPLYLFNRRGERTVP